MLTARLKTLNSLFFLAWIATLCIGIKVYTYIDTLFPYAIVDGRKEVSFVNMIAFVVYFAALLVILISWMLSGENGFFMARFKDYDKSWWKIDKNYATENNWNKI